VPRFRYAAPGSVMPQPSCADWPSPMPATTGSPGGRPVAFAASSVTGPIGAPGGTKLQELIPVQARRSTAVVRIVEGGQVDDTQRIGTGPAGPELRRSAGSPGSPARRPPMRCAATSLVRALSQPEQLVPGRVGFGGLPVIRGPPGCRTSWTSSVALVSAQIIAGAAVRRPGPGRRRSPLVGDAQRRNALPVDGLHGPANRPAWVAVHQSSGFCSA
jgi:hypothetical protein